MRMMGQSWEQNLNGWILSDQYNGLPFRVCFSCIVLTPDHPGIQALPVPAPNPRKTSGLTIRKICHWQNDWVRSILFLFQTDPAWFV